MSSINVEKLLSPVSGAAPTGESFYGRPAYSELDRMAQGRPEQQVGSSIIPAVPPDWDAVRKRCVELLEQTKDLRVAMHLVAALLQTEGLPGFRDGLRLLKGLVEQYWDALHPQLDPEDGNDPIERINILRLMASRSGSGAESGVVKMVRAARLTASRQLGGFGLRDVEATSNGAAKDGAAEGKPDLALIEASAKDTDPAYLTAAAAAAVESAALVRQIESIVDAKVGAGGGVDLKDLARALDAAAAQLQKFMALKGLTPAAPAGDPSAGDAPAAAGTGGGVAQPSAGAASAPGEIRSADDVRRLIDKMCDFYARTEPSSPVPIVLRRAQRLVGKNFWEILTDLSPSALDSVKTISGTEGPEEAS